MWREVGMYRENFFDGLALTVGQEYGIIAMLFYGRNRVCRVVDLYP
jgi:hypothetical protein